MPDTRSRKAKKTSPIQESPKKNSSAVIKPKIPNNQTQNTKYNNSTTPLQQLKSWLLKPQDPSLLGYLRIMYGILMTLDLLMERGMANMDAKFGDDVEDCRFPLINSLQFLPYKYMVLIHVLMAWSIICIAFGFLYRIHTFVYMISYWYIFLLDKTKWNNHSYLFGLFSIIFFFADANNYMAVDCLLFKKKCKNKHVPNIQYIIPRMQIFILYFFAAIKKTDQDWLDGYSMGKLGQNKLFDPFRMIGFSDEFINVHLVHHVGLFIDFFSPFFLFFEKTRLVGYTLMISFHGMNSQLFSIGMFPYTCLATMFIFNNCDSFRNLWRDSSKCVKNERWCIYQNEEQVTDKKTDQVVKASNDNTSIFSPIYLTIGLIYMAIQLFLPWSHFITLGYNGWTQGTYGYSWDMMIHSFATQHTKIYYKDPLTGEDGYLKTDSYTTGRASSRWTTHPDGLKQYAMCLNDRLRQVLNRTSSDPDFELYFDVWKSMNKRFHQRTYNPNIDIVASPWSPFKRPEYTLDLMYNFDNMRKPMNDKKKELVEDEFTEITFIADFPGLILENFLAADYKNTTVELLVGQAKVSFPEDESMEEIILEKGQATYLPANKFHNIETIGNEPSCYMYVYENNTFREWSYDYRKFETKMVEELKLDTLEKWDNYNYTVEIPEDADPENLPESITREQSFVEEYAYNLSRNDTKTATDTMNLFSKKRDQFLRFLEKRIGILRRTYVLIKQCYKVQVQLIPGDVYDYLELNSLDYFFSDSLFSEFMRKNRGKRRENDLKWRDMRIQDYQEAMSQMRVESV